MQVSSSRMNEFQLQEDEFFDFQKKFFKYSKDIKMRKINQNGWSQQ